MKLGLIGVVLLCVACGGAESMEEQRAGAGAGGNGGSQATAGQGGATGGQGGAPASGGAGGDGGDGGSQQLICAPGKVEACPCPGGGQGAQACRQDGMGYETCECGNGSGGAGGSGPDTSDWRWWCTYYPATDTSSSGCVCTFGRYGSENVDTCPDEFNCCHVSQSSDGITNRCQCGHDTINWCETRHQRNYRTACP